MVPTPHRAADIVLGSPGVLKSVGLKRPEMTRQRLRLDDALFDVAQTPRENFCVERVRQEAGVNFRPAIGAGVGDVHRSTREWVGEDRRHGEVSPGGPECRVGGVERDKGVGGDVDDGRVCGRGHDGAHEVCVCGRKSRHDCDLVLRGLGAVTQCVPDERVGGFTADDCLDFGEGKLCVGVGAAGCQWTLSVDLAILSALAKWIEL